MLKEYLVCSKIVTSKGIYLNGKYPITIKATLDLNHRQQNKGAKMKQKTIKATNKTINDIVEAEIERLGYEADLNHIDVSDVTRFDYTFSDVRFNGDISKWDVSKVKNMREMFKYSQFNGDISGWDVSNVTDMSRMFSGSKFNIYIENWNVRNVSNIADIFKNSAFEGESPAWNMKLINENNKNKK